MKTTLQLCILLFGTFIAKATILRCNNNPGVTGTYQTLYSALLVASPGDTIHLEPSPFSYGQIGSASVIGTQQFINTDNITFIGNGINVNNYPGIQADTMTSKIEYFFYGGDSCRYYGIDCSGAFFISGSHCIIENCRFLFLRFYKSNQILHNCNFPTNTEQFTNLFLPSLLFSAGVHDVEVSNCFFGGHLEVDSTTCYNLTFSHNTFHDSVTGGSFQISHFINTTFIDNVFKSNANGIDTSGNNLFINNVALSNSIILPATGGNVSGVSPGSMFALPYSRLEVDQYVLPSFTPQNVGMYGGTNPYNPVKLPPVPSIFYLDVPVVIQSNSSTITISTRSN